MWTCLDNLYCLLKSSFPRFPSNRYISLNTDSEEEDLGISAASSEVRCFLCCYTGHASDAHICRCCWNWIFKERKYIVINFLIMQPPHNYYGTYCHIEVLLEFNTVFLQDKSFSVKYLDTWLRLSCLSSRCSKCLPFFTLVIIKSNISYSFPMVEICLKLCAIYCVHRTIMNHFVIWSDLFRISFCNLYNQINIMTKLRLILWLGSADTLFIHDFYGDFYSFFG